MEVGQGQQGSQGGMRKLARRYFNVVGELIWD
jgi:hypothetical protein